MYARTIFPNANIDGKRPLSVSIHQTTNAGALGGVGAAASTDVAGMKLMVVLAYQQCRFQNWASSPQRLKGSSSATVLGCDYEYGSVLKRFDRAAYW